MAYEYESYGAFKTQNGGPRAAERIARMLGLRNRYMRFLKLARRDLPVLELGCGNGAFLAALLKAGFADVHGVEPSGSYTPIVPAHLISKAFAHEHLEKLPAESLGTVVALDVLEHISAPELNALLPLVASRLVAGGVMLFRVPNMASPLALINHFGDLSHVTALNEVSVQQLAFGSGLEVQGVYSEPFQYPYSPAIVAGMLLWPLYRFAARLVLAAFGVRTRVLTPNLVCVMRRP